MKFKFLDVCIDVTKNAIKIPQSSYLNSGLYPVYDQGKDLIGGYTNEEKGKSCDYPYIVFGDHTRVVKYIDNECFIGADGVKLLKVSNNDFIPKYVYYFMLANPVDNQGYARHYKLLKETYIKYVEKNKQIEVIKELDKIKDLLANKKRKLVLFDELIKSRFICQEDYNLCN